MTKCDKNAFQKHSLPSEQEFSPPSITGNTSD